MAKYAKHHVLGIDVGATGIKGAVVDTETGDFFTERIKLPTPKPATPDAIAEVIRDIAELHKWKSNRPVGCGFPAVIIDGTAFSAANIDNAWIGMNTEKFLKDSTGYHMAVLNDADAAGMAEVKFGYVEDKGTVILLTLGTGIGSALFRDGKLVPNTELGHIPYRRSVAEDYVSNRARKSRKLSMPKWSKELNIYLEHIHRIMTPDLIILGGGISKKFDQFSKNLDPGVKVVPAKLFNHAGIVGAALYALEKNAKG